MKKYTIKYSTGVEFTYTGSLLGAKRLATKNLCYGSSVTIYCGGIEVASRIQWDYGHMLFGWHPWQSLQLSTQH